MSTPPPRAWPTLTNEAFLQAAHLLHRLLATSANWCANNSLLRAQLQGHNTELTREVGLLREELAIKDARADPVPPQRRLHFQPAERLRILALRASRGWTIAETASRFGLTSDTVRRWITEARKPASALLRPKVPVNKYPDFVAAVVRQLAQANPKLGVRTLAAFLAREGLVLAKSTVDRMKTRPPPAPRPPVDKPDTPAAKGVPPASGRQIVAKHADHVWSLDLTVVPIFMDLAATWWPFSMPAVWPFSWHVLVVVDHFTRRIVHSQGFAANPSTKAVTRALDKVFRQGVVPDHIISDRGSQFGDRWAAWCRLRRIKPRWGAIGKHGSIAVTERTHRSLKRELLHHIRVPFDARVFNALLASYRVWFNEVRPHQALGNRTPAEKAKPTLVRKVVRIEARARYPDHGDAKPCRPAGLRLVVGCVDGHAPLTTVTLERVA